MNVILTEIPEVLLVKPKVFGDEPVSVISYQ